MKETFESAGSAGDAISGASPARTAQSELGSHPGSAGFAAPSQQERPDAIGDPAHRVGQPSLGQPNDDPELGRAGQPAAVPFVSPMDLGHAHGGGDLAHESAIQINPDATPGVLLALARARVDRLSDLFALAEGSNGSSALVNVATSVVDELCVLLEQAHERLFATTGGV